MGQRERAGHEAQQGSSKLEVMGHCELRHNYAANFRAVVRLVGLQLNFVASIRFASMDGPFEKREQRCQLRLLAAFVEVFVAVPTKVPS